MNKKMKRFCEKKREQFDYHTMLRLKNIKSPITLLMGPNGTGKSMSMKNIESECKEKKIKYVKYSTSNNDIVQKGAPAFGSWDPYKLACAFHSEGERMSDSFFDWANSDMLKAILEDKSCPVCILVDEADSGLSWDRLFYTLRPIVHVIEQEHERGRDIHIIFTCNSYEMMQCLSSEYQDIIWVPTKEHIKIGSYYTYMKKYVEYYDEVLKWEDDE